MSDKEYSPAELETFSKLEAEGWERVNVAEGFTGHVGPYWLKYSDHGVTVGLVVAARHTNNHLGTIHGGIVMSFADIGLGMGVVQSMGEKARNCVTTSLNTQFVSVAKVGEFITIEPEVVRSGRHLVFVRGLIKTPEKSIASVEGIWKLLEGELRVSS
ncbi:PaaI family thioesterase [Pseudomaricurvus sp. HS19]|uniref:PaaI family thioesterase n=1 Tax=Pseudomaricurvus sp. HS19 TaxID=2692626 RepID=UPI00136BA38B|nr:PaaI family thioesterase [Pseudomaricurvus sp. HS19]MYM63876.1 hotdog fold thioesterase [Pseudomaricurvus sp. HS19]